MLSIAIVAICLCHSAEGLKFHKQEDSAERYGAKKDALELKVHHKGGKGKSMKDSKSDDVSVSIALGGKKFQFDIVKTGDRTGTLTIGTTGDALSEDEKQQLRSLSDDLNEDEKPSNGRVGLGSKLLEYLSRLPGSNVMPNKTQAIKVRASHGGQEKTPNETSPTRHSRRLQSVYCNGVWVESREATSECPQLIASSSSWYYSVARWWWEGDDGATCMCPYGGGRLWPAYYGGRDGMYRWYRYHGSDTSSCKGRCGQGCNSWDNEAFQDCFDHDICGSHYSGSAYIDNPDCWNEFLAAADDYIVSYGWSCCQTFQWWNPFSWF